MAGTLILEAIVVLLALPVVAAADGGLTPVTGTYLIGLAVVLILLAGLQGRPWAIWVESRHPGGAYRRWVVHGAVGFIGLVFAGVWLLILYLRSEVRRREAARPAARPTAPARLITANENWGSQLPYITGAEVSLLCPSDRMNPNDRWVVRMNNPRNFDRTHPIAPHRWRPRERLRHPHRRQPCLSCPLRTARCLLAVRPAARGHVLQPAAAAIQPAATGSRASGCPTAVVPAPRRRIRSRSGGCRDSPGRPVGDVGVGRRCFDHARQHHRDAVAAGARPAGACAGVARPPPSQSVVVQPAPTYVPRQQVPAPRVHRPIRRPNNPAPVGPSSPVSPAPDPNQNPAAQHPQDQTPHQHRRGQNPAGQNPAGRIRRGRIRRAESGCAERRRATRGRHPAPRAGSSTGATDRRIRRP